MPLLVKYHTFYSNLTKGTVRSDIVYVETLHTLYHPILVVAVYKLHLSKPLNHAYVHPWVIFPIQFDKFFFKRKFARKNGQCNF